MTKEEIQLRAQTLQESFKAMNRELEEARRALVEIEKRYRTLTEVVEGFRGECSALLLAMRGLAYAAEDNSTPDQKALEGTVKSGEEPA